MTTQEEIKTDMTKSLLIDGLKDAVRHARGTNKFATQEEIKAVVARLTDLADYFCFMCADAKLQVSLRKAADLIERLAAERAAGEFWRGVFDEITDKTDREKIEAELSDYHFMMEQVPTVYMHITGGKMSKCNYYDHAVIAEADEYQNKLIDEAVQEALERSKDDESTSVSAHIKPLVWKELVRLNPKTLHALTPFGAYRMQLIGGPVAQTWELLAFGPLDQRRLLGAFLTQEEAEAAANADWSERISPMLTVGPSPAAPTPAIPEGWKLVPIEPTEKMIEDGHATIPGILDVCLADVEDAWTAMLTASPAPGGQSE